jgi:hypothetical protein
MNYRDPGVSSNVLAVFVFGLSPRVFRGVLDRAGDVRR